MKIKYIIKRYGIVIILFIILNIFIQRRFVDGMNFYHVSELAQSFSMLFFNIILLFIEAVMISYVSKKFFR